MAALGGSNFVTPFGCVLGVFDGVEGFSNGSDRHFSGEQNFVRNIYTGIKYQCVEYARRWLLSKDLKFDSVPMANHIWKIRFLETVTDKRTVLITPVPNGSKSPPVVGSFLIWKVAPDVPFGHIAVIADVSIELGYVRIAEQNVENNYWPGNYARELKLEVIEGQYWIRDEDEMFGWMVIDFNTDSHDSRIYKLENPVNRISKLKEKQGNWLDLQNIVENKYYQHWGTSLHEGENVDFYTIESFLADKVHFATLECSFMCMFGARKIANSDEALAKLNFPQWSWALIRKSINNFFEGDGKVMFTRLEFGFNGKKIKLLDADGEPTNGLLEVALLQDKFANFHGIEVGTSSSANIRETLKIVFEDSIRGFIHLLIHEDPHSEYYAHYLQQIFGEIGIESKIIEGLNFTRNEEGKFFDDEGREILRVWKSYDWPSVFKDFESPRIGENLKISDILLAEHIEVFEPIWKSILKNKGFYTYLWEAFVDHDYLLRTNWDDEGSFGSQSFKRVSCAFGPDQEFLQENFERASFGGLTPSIYSWPCRRELSGFYMSERSETSQSPFIVCRVLDDN